MRRPGSIDLHRRCWLCHFRSIWNNSHVAVVCRPMACGGPGLALLNRGRLMSLVPNANGPVDDYNVVHGQLRIGQIYRRQAALRAEAQWLWALNGAPECPDGLACTGHAASL